MKKLLFINLLVAIFFVIILKISGPCIVIENLGHYDSFGWPKMYGIEFYYIGISWQVLLNIMIALMIVYLITLIKMLFTIFKLKKLSLKFSKNQLILIFLGLFVVISLVTITVFEREEAVSVREYYKFRLDYDSITVDEYNKGYVILKKFNGETTRMKASPKTMEFIINRAVIEKRNIRIYYRRNILLQTEYKISGVVLTWTGAVLPEPQYYIPYFRRRKDFGLGGNLSHEKIYYKYRKKYLERMERELDK
ncbi:UNVERIFIED_CONTAM: hypothetical protein Cloal_0452 [Acetivibrio alkalicellulosi]